MPTFPEFKVGRAEVCEITHVTDCGPGPQYFVRLPDGYLIECGIDKKRAGFVADCINLPLKWSNTYPPIGVIESVVRFDFADEDRYAHQQKTEG